MHESGGVLEIFTQLVGEKDYQGRCHSDQQKDENHCFQVVGFHDVIHNGYIYKDLPLTITAPANARPK